MLITGVFGCRYLLKFSGLRITCCFAALSIYRVLQENKNLKSLLSGRTLLNPGVRPVLTINLAGVVGRDSDASAANSYEG